MSRVFTACDRGPLRFPSARCVRHAVSTCLFLNREITRHRAALCDHQTTARHSTGYLFEKPLQGRLPGLSFSKRYTGLVPRDAERLLNAALGRVIPPTSFIVSCDCDGDDLCSRIECGPCLRMPPRVQPHPCEGCPRCVHGASPAFVRYRTVRSDSCLVFSFWISRVERTKEPSGGLF